MNPDFENKIKTLFSKQENLLSRKNPPRKNSNGIYTRYEHPILTAEHVPVHWRYDLSEEDNPYLMERMGINAVFNAGAIEFKGKICVIARVEGWDRKSFFAIAESENGIDNFRFWDYPVVIPETEDPDTNTYDMRLVKHEDGWIYGLFCAERKDKEHPEDLSAAVASCGIARTKDLKNWERLPDLETPAKQQRNCVLHPTFVDGKYAFYTRPLTHFAATGTGAGIGWGLTENINNPVIKEEVILDERVYHTIKEGKNGQGPAPIKTEQGWLHLAHAVRDTAAGMRYVLYAFLTDLDNPEKVIKQPGGYFMAPEFDERIGDVSNVLFTNGWVAKENGDLFIYYGSSDTRLHVATTTVNKMLDYVMNTPKDGLRTFACIQQRNQLITKNLQILEGLGLKEAVKVKA